MFTLVIIEEYPDIDSSIIITKLIARKSVCSRIQVSLRKPSESNLGRWRWNDATSGWKVGG